MVRASLTRLAMFNAFKMVTGPDSRGYRWPRSERRDLLVR